MLKIKFALGFTIFSIFGLLSFFPLFILSCAFVELLHQDIFSLRVLFCVLILIFGTFYSLVTIAEGVDDYINGDVGVFW